MEVPVYYDVPQFVPTQGKVVKIEQEKRIEKVVEVPVYAKPSIAHLRSWHLDLRILSNFTLLAFTSKLYIHLVYFTRSA